MQGRAGQCMAGLCKAGLCKAGLCKAGQCKAGQWGVVVGGGGGLVPHTMHTFLRLLLSLDTPGPPWMQLLTIFHCNMPCCPKASLEIEWIIEMSL